MSYDWSELEDIFQKCLDLEEDKRKAFIIHKAKGNHELLSTLLEMLKNTEEANSYFNDLQFEIAKGMHNSNSERLLEAGEVIDKYEIIDLIGKGGMGEVYMARRNDNEFEQIVAIKCFSPSQHDDQILHIFKREKKFLSKLEHPSIAIILDAGIHDGRYPYLIMQYAKGTGLLDFLKAHSLSQEDKLTLFLKICEAIQFAHQQLILHLDIKPSNILVEDINAIKLLDFGISSHLDEIVDIEKLRASPFYAAPEQYQSKEAYLSTDIYQLGIILHIILTTELPFHQNELHLAYKKPSIDESLPIEFQVIIKKALNHKPENRFNSVQEVIDRVSLIKSGYGIPELSDRWQYRTKKFIERNTLVTSLISLLIVTLISGLLLSYLNMKAANASKRKAEKTNEFLLSLFENSNPAKVEARALSLKDVLKNSEASIDKYFTEPEDQRKLYASLISIYTNANLWQEAVDLASKSLSKGPVKTIEDFKVYRNVARSHRYLSNYAVADSIYNYFTLPVLKGNHPFNIPKLDIAMALSDWGKLKQIKAEHDSALILLNKAEQYLNSDSSILQSTIYQHKASLHLDLSDYSLAESYQKEAIKILRRYDDYLEMQTAQIGLGIIYKNKEDHKKSIQILKESIMLHRKHDLSDSLNIAVAYGNLGGNYYSLDQYDSASWYLESALRIFKKKFDPQNNYIISTLFNLANVYLDQEKIDKALNTYQFILKIDRDVFGKDHPIVADDYVAVSICYRLNKSYDSAIHFLNKAQAVYELSLPDNHKRFSRLYNKYAQVYELKANKELADFYHSKANSIQ